MKEKERLEQSQGTHNDVGSQQPMFAHFGQFSLNYEHNNLHHSYSPEHYYH